jgi:hypothetical protein
LKAQKIGVDGMYYEMQLINIISKDLQLEYIHEKWQPKQM